MLNVLGNFEFNIHMIHKYYQDNKVIHHSLVYVELPVWLITTTDTLSIQITDY